MSSILNFFRRKLLRPVPRKKLVQTPRFVKPCLEILEGRLVLDAMLFVGAGGTLAAPLNWFVAANWADLTNPPNVHVPDASDDVGIPGAAGVVAINGDAEVNSIVTGSGSTLQTTSGSELKIDSNPPATLPPSFPADPLANSNFFGGSVIDAGLINLNTTNPFTGTNAAFAGGTTIGPGDLKGNLEAGPNSSFTFSGGTNTFVAGATLSGMGTGSIIIAAPVTVMGALNGGTETLSVATGGTLGGPGALDEFSTLTWTGGAISVGGGVTVESSGTLTASGAASKTLSTVLTNNSPFANLGGGGMLILSAGGSVLNSAGNLQLSLPSVEGNLEVTGTGTLTVRAVWSIPGVCNWTPVRRRVSVRISKRRSARWR